MTIKAISSSLALASFLLVLVATTSGEMAEVIDGKQLKEMLVGEPYVFAFFYAAWCPHSQKLQPVFDESSDIYGPDTVEFVKINVDDDPLADELRTEFDIQAYPKLIFFKKGQPFTYEGALDSQHISLFAFKLSNPLVSLIDTRRSLDVFTAVEGIKVYGVFFKDRQKYEEIFLSLAQDFILEHAFAIVTEPELWGAILDNAHKKDVNVVIVRPFSPSVIHVQPEEIDAYASSSIIRARMIDVLEKYSFPSYDEIADDNYNKYKDRGLPIVYLVFESEDEHQRQKYLPILEEVAESNKGGFSFGYLDGKVYSGQLEYFGFDSMPAVAIEDGKNRFAMEQQPTLTVSQITDFISDFQQGKLQRLRLSESIPTNEVDDRGFLTLVADNFNEKVFQSGVDTFIFFYSDDCTDCGHLLTKWERANKLFAKETKVKIRFAVMNVSKNESPDDFYDEFFEAEKYPQLVLAQKSSPGLPLVFEKDLQYLTDLIRFIHENTSTEFIPPVDFDEVMDKMGEFQKKLPQMLEQLQNMPSSSPEMAEIKAKLQAMNENKQQKPSNVDMGSGREDL